MLRPTTTIAVTLILLALSAATLADDESDEPATGFLHKTLEFEDETYAYNVFVPPGYTPDKAWPLILFLHGSGERGTDGFLQTEVGIGRAIRRNHERVPAIVVMPQCRPRAAWVGKMGQMALHCVERTSREYRIDANRVYLTGLSLGGQGAWLLGAQHARHFAAIVPICGFVNLGDEDAAEKTREIAKHLKDVPIWCFHGAEDDRVPVDNTRTMVAALRAAGGTVYYTEFAEGNHFIWNRVYDKPEFWRWLLSQRRGRPADAPPQP